MDVGEELYGADEPDQKKKTRGEETGMKLWIVVAQGITEEWQQPSQELTVNWWAQMLVLARRNESPQL